MEELLKAAELFEGLNDEGLRRLSGIGRRRTLRAGEYLFVLGDDAGDFYVVIRGKVDLCFPMPLRGEVKDVSVESVGEGQALGWSSLVKPYRFTLSARATEPSEVVSFARRSLMEVFEAEPRIGHAFFMKISELVGIRLVTFQALWVRELQRLAERPPALHP
jgi:CRP-like cAMP-binding protein